MFFANQTRAGFLSHAIKGVIVMLQRWPGLVPREMVRTTCVAVCAGHALVALVLVWRSLAGALTRELSPLAACVVATAAVATGMSAWLASRWTRAESPHQHWLDVAAAFAPPLLVMIVAVPESSVGAIAYATVLVTLCAGVVWIVEDGHLSGPLPNAVEPESSEVARPDSAGDEGGGVVQWMSRSQAPDGGETVEGGVRVSFAPGQRQEVLHVSFCPPLASAPDVECEVLDDAPVAVRVTAAHPYGLRLEARRDDAREALTTEIGFAATARAAQAVAA